MAALPWRSPACRHRAARSSLRVSQAAVGIFMDESPAARRGSPEGSGKSGAPGDRLSVLLQPYFVHPPSAMRHNLMPASPRWQDGGKP